jgi:hypothetical protein
MNMIARKLKPAPIDGDDVLAVLTQRCRELDARRVVVTETIIAVEKTVGAAQFDVTADMVQAEALLNGAQFVASREKPISQLAALHAERDVIDRALKIGRSREHRLAVERSSEIWAAHFTEIAAIEKQRVLLAFELQRTNRAREALRQKIAKAGGAGYLSTDGIELLGLGGDAEINWAANRLIADGIATRGEIEKARSDG